MCDNKCVKCIHFGQETTDDVACCNLCGEDGLDFFQEDTRTYEEEE